MNEHSERGGGPRLTSLLCRRTGERVSPGEHAACPYCYGRLADVETGRHEAFCDYREGTDPVSFGFPDDGARLRGG